MIPLPYVIEINYPTAIAGTNYQLADHNDGNGPFIQFWDVPGFDMPTDKELAILRNTPTTLQKYAFFLNYQKNKPIYDALDALDLKTIRPLRAGDMQKVEELEAQAVALRAQLLPTR